MERANVAHCSGGVAEAVLLRVQIPIPEPQADRPTHPPELTIAITHPGAGLKTQNSLRTASSLGLDTDLPARVVHADAVVEIPRAPEDVVVLLLEEVAAARAAAAGLGRRRRGEVVGARVEGARPLANSIS